MSVDKPQLSVVVPVHNEAAGIAVFHKQLLAVLEGVHTPFEVIYVDDGSTDSTAPVPVSYTHLTLPTNREV